MKIKAAVLRDSGKPQPYANSRPLSIEKIAPGGYRFAHIAGALFVAAGVYIIIHG